MAVLLIAGFVVGAIGSRIFGLERPFVAQPEIHLPPQPIFPAEARDSALGLAPAKDEHGAMSSSDDQHAKSSDAHVGDGEKGHGDAEGHHYPLKRHDYSTPPLSSFRLRPAPLEPGRLEP